MALWRGTKTRRERRRDVATHYLFHVACRMDVGIIRITLKHYLTESSNTKCIFNQLILAELLYLFSRHASFNAGRQHDTTRYAKWSNKQFTIHMNILYPVWKLWIHPSSPLWCRTSSNSLSSNFPTMPRRLLWQPETIMANSKHSEWK